MSAGVKKKTPIIKINKPIVLFSHTLGFERVSMSVEEPERGDDMLVMIPLVRMGGTLGVVAVDWKATLNGKVIVKCQYGLKKTLKEFFFK